MGSMQQDKGKPVAAEPVLSCRLPGQGVSRASARLVEEVLDSVMKVSWLVVGNEESVEWAVKRAPLSMEDGETRR
jgi:hypothetical protein